jgi:hypothetical protein
MLLLKGTVSRDFRPLFFSSNNSSSSNTDPRVKRLLAYIFEFAKKF